jgi:hypothetical protein
MAQKEYSAHADLRVIAIAKQVQPHLERRDVSRS